MILRPHAVYGPGDTTLLPRVLAARRLGAFPLPGDGRNRISVTCVFNLAQAVQLALEGACSSGASTTSPTRKSPPSTICCGPCCAATGIADRLLHVPHWAARSLAAVNETVWRLARISGEPSLTRYAVAHLAEPFTLDLTRARTLLGYAPRWTFRDAL